MSIEHIVIFARSIPLHSIGGMEMVTWDLARTFRDMGLKVSCITTSIPNYSREFRYEEIDIIALDSSRSGKYSKKWFKTSANYFVDNFLKSNCVVLSVSAGAAGLIDRRDELLNIPIVFQAHGTSIGEIKSKFKTLKPKLIASSLLNIYWFFKDMGFYQKVSSAVAVGDRVYKDLKTFPNKIFFKNTKIELIRNGVDSKLFKFNALERERLRARYNIKSSIKVIISASRLHRQKGIHLSIKGFAEYLKVNSNAIYIIIGDGKERSNLECLAEELGIESKVLFLGTMQREKLANYLSVGDIFLFTTLHNEGLPLNALEALSSGLKVIISEHIEGIIKINKDAVIAVNPHSSKDIAKALDYIICRQNVSYLPREYSLDYCANRYIELFQSLSSS